MKSRNGNQSKKIFMLDNKRSVLSKKEIQKLKKELVFHKEEKLVNTSSFCLAGHGAARMKADGFCLTAGTCEI